MRWLVSIIVALFLVGMVSAISHNDYPEFSRAPLPYYEQLHLSSNNFSYVDDVVYEKAYYSINGDEWQEFTLHGERYGENNEWLTGKVSYLLPNEMWNQGEHYIISYSCTDDEGTWNCHGTNELPEGQWRLIVMGYSENFTSDCGDILDYQCGMRTICDSERNYGDCNNGYDCNDNLCIAQDNLSCEEITCEKEEYCSRGVCLFNATGNTYFVATWGNDTNNGTFEAPFYRWQQAVLVAQPGDVTYIRGGVWQPTTHVIRTGGYETSQLGMEIRAGPYSDGERGTAENPIRYYNYPGEKPIIDGKLLRPSSGGWNGGLDISNTEYIHLKGLTVRHVHQYPPNFTRQVGREYAEAYGIGCGQCANIHYENLVVHDIDGRGFSHWSGGSMEPEEMDFPFRYDNSSWINCDVYNVYDRYDNTPGNAADAWIVHGNYPNNFYFEGCRAWNYSDDGYDIHGQSYRHFKNSWAMSTDKYKGRNDFWGIEGNGWKLPGISPSQTPTYELGGESFVKVERCIAANSIAAGFLNNLGVDHENNLDNNGIYRNNFAYKTGSGYRSDGSNLEAPFRTTNYTNNIVYASTGDYEVQIYRPDIYPNANNTWLPTERGPVHGWPGWKYNPDFNVTDEDFVSLDYWQLVKPRKADGSLPDITFGHLVEGSDLIDAGTIISGYHCPTAGDQEGCVVWYGNAPDLGPFEFQG